MDQRAACPGDHGALASTAAPNDDKHPGVFVVGIGIDGDTDTDTDTGVPGSRLILRTRLGRSCTSWCGLPNPGPWGHRPRPPPMRTARAAGSRPSAIGFGPFRPGPAKGAACVRRATRGLRRKTAAHLVDHVIPPLPVRQWVLSVPKRLRWCLEREPQAVSAVRHILLRVVDGYLRRSSDAGPDARFGAVSFIHRFGASLNQHIHDHCCVIDGVFEPVEEADDVPQSVRFCPAAALTPEAVAAIAEQVRVRVLRWFARSGLIERDDVRDMLAWENSGFSLDAAVRVGAHDRAGLERLLRYCARPAFALERLERLDDERVVYRSPKPQRDGITALTPTPLELIDHLAALIPPPRRHRHRYHGVLAPNAPLPPRCTAAESPYTPQSLCLHRPDARQPPLFGVDHRSRPRERPLPSLPGRSGWLGFPIRRRLTHATGEPPRTPATRAGIRDIWRVELAGRRLWAHRQRAAARYADVTAPDDLGAVGAPVAAEPRGRAAGAPLSPAGSDPDRHASWRSRAAGRSPACR
jgi:hypothetical protein